MQFEQGEKWEGEIVQILLPLNFFFKAKQPYDHLNYIFMLSLEPDYFNKHCPVVLFQRKAFYISN